MSTLDGVLIIGSGGLVLCRVRRLSPVAYFAEAARSDGAWNINEVLTAKMAANNIAAYLNEYFNPIKEGKDDDTRNATA